tara:strand:+ start:239 stop:460 length:222 start_codon:yes stop_codon:yes gene_type:complete
MAVFNIAKIIRIKYHFICEMCGVSKNGKQFQYKAFSYVSTYKPPLLEVCEDCVYKEIYGSKVWRKMKIQKVLE